MPTYYELLEISEKATTTDVKSAYRRLAKKYHPDLNPAENAKEKFIEIEVAYTCLSNATNRSAYDRLLRFERQHNYASSTAHQKYQNDVSRNRSQAQRRAQQRTQMSYRQYKRDEMMQTTLMRMLAKTGITLVVAFVLGAGFYYTARGLYGPELKGASLGSLMLISMFFVLALIGSSYIYEPFINRVIVGKPKRDTTRKRP